MVSRAALSEYVAQARPDLASVVTHWTKETYQRSFTEPTTLGLRAFDVLRKILREGRIEASDGAVLNGRKKPVVCFSEAPLGFMARAFKGADFDRQSCTFRNRKVGDFIKYRPYGLSFDKNVIYGQFGGRPVLYLSHDEMARFVCEGILWRVVTFENADLSHVVDWTHEREWRAPMSIPFAALPSHAKPLAIVAAPEEKDLLECEFPSNADGPFAGVVCITDLLTH